MTPPISPEGLPEPSRSTRMDSLPLPILPTPTKPSQGPLDLSQLSGRAFQILPPLLVGLPTTPSTLAGPPDPSWPYWRAFQPRPSLLEGLATPSSPSGEPPYFSRPSWG